MWFARTGTVAPHFFSGVAYLGDRHPDATLLDLVGDPAAQAELAGTPWLLRVEASERGLFAVRVRPGVLDAAPPLWFVLVDEPRASPAAVNLVAFTGDEHEPGTVISNHGFAGLRVPSERQLGAVRWYAGTGVVHQIYVGQDWRRRHVGSALLYAAAGVARALGHPPLHSDGRRTDIGEQFVVGLRHPQRIRPRDTVLPSMDPPEAPTR